MKKFNLFITIFLIVNFNCSLLEPSKLILKNNSDYSISVSIDGTNQKNVTIDKNNGEIFFLNPGNAKITIRIDKIYYSKQYQISIGYLENKEFKFDLKN